MANGKFAGGDGSKENPFLIEDAFDLDAIRNGVDKCYKLINDIDLNVKPFNEGEGWKTVKNEFSGVLDGCGFRILNLFVNIKNKEVSFIESLKKDGCIKNIFFKKSKIILDNSKFYLNDISDSKSITNIALDVSCDIKNNSEIFVVSGIRQKCEYSNLKVVYKINSDDTSEVGFANILRDDGRLGSNIAIFKVLSGKPKILYVKDLGRLGYEHPYVSSDAFYTSYDYNEVHSEKGTKINKENLKKILTYQNYGWQYKKREDGNELVWILKEGQIPKLWFEENIKMLFKEHDKIYYIKNDCVICNKTFHTTELDENIFNKYGFSDRKILNMNTFKGQVRMKNESKCHDGALFSYKIDDWIKNITVG